MKAIQALLIVMLAVTGLAAAIAPALATALPLSSYPAISLEYNNHLFFLPTIAPECDPVDCPGGGC